MTGVVGTSATQTLTNKTISYADNTMPGVVGETATQTLTNKTIDAKDNVMLCTATNITSSQTITPTKQMMVTAGTSGITLTLGSGPYAGYALPILAVADCQVSYTGIDGAATETLDVGSYITFIWDATGSYWVVDAGAFEKPTYISTTQTLTPVKKMIAVVNTQGVELTLDDGPYDGFELPVLATADCQIVYTGINGSVTKNVQTNTYNEFVWGGTYWLPRESTAITGVDDNGQPFAFNIDALTEPDGVINITGTDANGNPFDYGLGKLVLAADEDNIVTGVEIKTSKTLNGKPIYMIESSVAVSTIDTASQFSDFFPATMDKIVSLNVLEDLSTGVTLTNGVHFSNTEKFWAYHNGGQKLYVYTHWAGTVRVTTEYTKTTDA
jgi:hypothetical protein